MVKRIRTLLTLFLLVMGTTVSWAEFKDFALDFTKNWADGNKIKQSDLYVTSFDANGNPVLATDKPASYMACINMKYHGNQYGVYGGRIKVPVEAGKYEVCLGTTDYGGEVNISNGTKIIAKINNSGAKFFVNPGNIVTGVIDVESDCELEIYATNAGSVYFPYISIAKMKDITFKDFALDFTLSWANADKISQNKSLYVTGFDGDVPVTTTDKPASYMACINMKYHGNQYGVYGGNIKVPVKAGKYEIGLGTTDYGGDVNFSDGTKNVTVINNSGAKFFNDKTKIAIGVANVESDCILDISATNLGSVYYPYISIKRIGDAEIITERKVSYYNTNGNLIGEETVEGNSALKFKYGVDEVTVPSGEKFRGWYDGNTSSAKPVYEGVALTSDMKLYAKTTPIEVATTTSTHFYDLTKANWYQEEHDLIEISGGKYYQDGSHGWTVSEGSTVKLKVAGDAIVSVGTCCYPSNVEQVMVTVTDASNKKVAEFNAKAATDGAVQSFKYTGAATTLTLTYGGVSYVHTVSVEHTAPVAFEPFKIDFRTNPYTVVVPEDGKLPACVKSIEGTWHDAQHGYSNKVGATISVDRPVKFYIGGCSQSHSNAAVSINGGAPEEITTMTTNCDNGDSYDVYATFIYKGTESATLKFTLGEYCPYIIAEEWGGVKYDETTNTYMVAAGNVNQFKDAISAANATGNVTIYLPNGTYDLGKDINTVINGDNIAIIGESRDGVIIKNAPTEEGLDKSATLKNTSTGLYLQDLTIQCYAPYNSSEKAERGVALWDKGTKTICKNVYLKGKQDTYYSNGVKGMIAYFEGGKIEGAVDFVCGSGSVLFNSVTLNVVDGTNSGNVIAAPSTYKSENGYVFANCKITGASSKEKNYYLARGWQNSPAALFVHTNFDVNPNTSYWGHNINTLESRRFAAYGTGASNDSDTTPMDKASLKNFAGDWDPAAIISQHKPIKTNGAGWASYTAFTDVVVNGADVKAYVARKINAKTVTLESIDGNKIPAGTPVFIYGADNSKYYVNGVVAGSVSGKNHLKPVLFDTTLKSGSNAFVIGTRDGVCGLYSVNSNILVPAGKCYLDATGCSLVLAKDGLEIEILDAETTGIDNVGVDADDDATHYNLAGQKVGKDYKGIVVRKDGKKYLAK